MGCVYGTFTFFTVMWNLADLSVISLNVNGIRDQMKRHNFFHFLRNTRADIILLQETHSTLQDERVWSNEWGNRIVFCHGTNFSKGVAILFNRLNSAEKLQVTIDLNGRFVIMELRIENIEFLLINVYGPNEDDSSFYIRLFELIENKQNNAIIMGGDFNTSLDPEKDLLGNRGLNHVRKREVIKNFLDKMGLVDAWRLFHPDERVYTWR